MTCWPNLKGCAGRQRSRVAMRWRWRNTRIDQLYSKALALYSKGSVPAGRLALSIMGRRAKLNGLDAPTKIAPTDPTGEHPADTGAIDVSTLSEDTLRRVLRDEKREPLDVTRYR